MERGVRSPELARGHVALWHGGVAPLGRIGPVGLRVAVNPYTNKPAEPPAMLVDFGERTRQSLELFTTDAMAVAERLRLWEQETR